MHLIDAALHHASTLDSCSSAHRRAADRNSAGCWQASTSNERLRRNRWHISAQRLSSMPRLPLFYYYGTVESWRSYPSCQPDQFGDTTSALCGRAHRTSPHAEVHTLPAKSRRSEERLRLGSTAISCRQKLSAATVKGAVLSSSCSAHPGCWATAPAVSGAANSLPRHADERMRLVGSNFVIAAAKGLDVAGSATCHPSNPSTQA